MPGTHSTASALEDMFSLGQKLFSEALARPRATIPPGGPLPPFESRDIWQIGVDSLDEKVERFNKKFTKQSVLTQGTYITNEVRAMERENADDIDDLELETDAMGIEAAGVRGMVVSAKPPNQDVIQEYLAYADETTDGNLDATLNLVSNIDEDNVAGIDGP